MVEQKVDGSRVDEVSHYIGAGEANFEISEKLEQVKAEIKAVLEKHGVAACVQMADADHANFYQYVPTWSKVYFEEHDNHIGIRVKSKASEGHEVLGSSLHMLLGMRDAVLEHARFMIVMGDALEQVLNSSDAVELEHKTLQQRIAERENGATPDSLKDEDNGEN